MVSERTERACSAYAGQNQKEDTSCPESQGRCSEHLTAQIDCSEPNTQRWPTAPLNRLEARARPERARRGTIVPRTSERGRKPRIKLIERRCSAAQEVCCKDSCKDEPSPREDRE